MLTAFAVIVIALALIMFIIALVMIVTVARRFMKDEKQVRVIRDQSRKLFGF